MDRKQHVRTTNECAYCGETIPAWMGYCCPTCDENREVDPLYEDIYDDGSDILDVIDRKKGSR